MLLDNLTDRGNFPILSNLVEHNLLQFSADNMNIIEETLDGQGTVHAAQVIVFQRGIPRRRRGYDWDLVGHSRYQ